MWRLAPTSLRVLSGSHEFDTWLPVYYTTRPFMLWVLGYIVISLEEYGTKKVTLARGKRAGFLMALLGWSFILLFYWTWRVTYRLPSL